MRVLLADDHSIVRRGLRGLLEAAGLTVIAEASDGLEAIRLCEEHHPDVLILDIAMPKLSGIEVAARLVEPVPGLHEHERPKTRIVPPAQFEANIRALFARPSEIVFGSESADAASQPFTTAVVGLVERHHGDTAVVTHGTVMALFVAAHTGRDAFEVWQQQRMPCAALLTLPDYGSLLTLG